MHYIKYVSIISEKENPTIFLERKMLDFQSIEKFIAHLVDFDQPTHDLGCREVGRSLTIEVSREFFYLQQLQQITVTFGYRSDNEGIGRTMFSCLHTAQLTKKFS